jgi:hypothetical protein
MAATANPLYQGMVEPSSVVSLPGEFILQLTTTLEQSDWRSIKKTSGERGQGTDKQDPPQVRPGSTADRKLHLTHRRPGSVEVLAPLARSLVVRVRPNVSQLRLLMRGPIHQQNFGRQKRTPNPTLTRTTSVCSLIPNATMLPTSKFGVISEPYRYQRVRVGSTVGLPETGAGAVRVFSPQSSIPSGGEQKLAAP